MTQAKLVKVLQGEEGSRLDKWLHKKIPSMPRSLMQKLFRKRAFKVDGKRAKADQLLEIGQIVRIPPIEERDIKKIPHKISEKDKKLIKSMVIFDDGHVIALNKPAGIAVQGGTNIKKHIDAMLDALVDKNGNRPKIVHRLDKDTSGVLLLARTDRAARELGHMFKGKDIRKYYWAITASTPETDSGTIRAAIRKGGGEGKEKMRIDEVNGKKATTEFAVIDRAHKKAAFVTFWPRTGRTHQIRVHAAQILNAPIMGDGKYGGKGAFLEGNIDIVKERVHLHARRIILPHPTKSGILDITAPLSTDLVRSWKSLGFNSNYKGDPFENLE